MESISTPDPTDAPAPAEPRPAGNCEILALWGRHQDLSRERRRSRRELAETRSRLGRLLSELRAEYRCGRGEASFSAWLRENGISRTSAYRLIEAHENPAKPAAPPPSTCTSGTTPPATPPLAESVCELKANALTLRLDDRQAERIRRCLDLRARIGLPPAELADLVCAALESSIPNNALQTIETRAHALRIARAIQDSFDRAGALLPAHAIYGKPDNWRPPPGPPPAELSDRAPPRCPPRASPGGPADAQSA